MTSDPDLRHALGELVTAYACGVDRLELDRVAGLFAPDGVLRQLDPVSGGDRYRREGRAEVRAALGGLERYLSTFHHVGQHRVEADPDDPDRATGEAYCIAHHVRPRRDDEPVETGHTDHVMYIRYQDTYVRVDGSWHFADRCLHVDWTEQRPATHPGP